ncbi:restriction endonuclease subunit S [Melissococcus sp. OM08-11BH]|uniref:restriction endonuclease subunit S n=1 Tax=Melissococcus sp. OM08-11BH TaxID=2293110 RepID=UPI000E4C05EC|nr:restriction endonuclease subunit S [Melissococcus sp. OM08-11BH]RGI30990.1 restriction endonuclease subunit S [Melissococcus sp. OM08-11BH]
MTTNHLTPVIRFKGFTDAWEQRKLGELVDFIVDNRGKNPPCYHNQGIPVIDNYMIKNTRYPNLSLANRYIDKNTYNSFIRKQTLHDDILITLVGNGIGNICLSPNEVSVIIQNTLGLRFNLNNKDFMFYTLQDKNGEIKKLDRGMAQPSIRQDELLNIEILIPKKVEQTKIGSFFKQLDDTIALHQRELDLLKEQKKGFLQKMFPKKDELVPEIRFAGFTDAWEQRKLGEVSDIFDGTHQTPKYTESGIKFVSVENIKNLETKKFISIEAYEKEYANKKAEKGDVLMSRIGDIGTTNVVKDNSPLAYYVTLALLKPKHIDSNFLSWVINSREVQNDIWRHTLHIAFPKKINLGEINKVDLAIPSIEEQTKIGNFFKQLDDTIALHQCELEKLQEMKKAFLQKMFV